MFWCGKKGLGLFTTYPTTFYNTYQKNLIAFCLPDTHPYLMSFDKSDSVPHNMNPASSILGTIITTRMIKKSIDNANNNLLYLKYSFALANV